MANLIYQELGKFEFLRRNHAAIEGELREISRFLRSAYPGPVQPVTKEDVWVITNCEAGIDRAGKVDPAFVHSRGEVGLFPLPDDIRDWNGPEAPVWNEPMPVEENLYHYFLYMGHLKNRVVKTLDGYKLYRDLFRGRQGNAPASGAKVLAGVVHGYFFAGNYSDGQVPLQHLLNGYKTNGGLADMMRSTTFVHAGTAIIASRERNINDALEELADD